MSSNSNPQPQRRLRWPSVPPPEDEFDVLARAEIVGGKVRTRAEILARLNAANGDPITVAALRIGNRELGEHGLIADILPFKDLGASELPP